MNQFFLLISVLKRIFHHFALFEDWRLSDFTPSGRLLLYEAFFRVSYFLALKKSLRQGFSKGMGGGAENRVIVISEKIC